MSAACTFLGKTAARRCGRFRNCNNNFAARLKISDACHLVLGQVIRSNLLDDRAKNAIMPFAKLIPWKLQPSHTKQNVKFDRFDPLIDLSSHLKYYSRPSLKRVIECFVCSV